jgi:hypothetical protein
MKTRGYLSLLVSLGVCASAPAQYSLNIVGYYHKTLYAGDNLIANQLAKADNGLSDLFSNVPHGSTFTKWDAEQLEFLPVSVYDQSTGWSIQFDLNYGEGGLFHAAATFTNTFVGSVWPGLDGEDEGFIPPLFPGVGLFLRSSVVPLNRATFYHVIGRDPQDGEIVTLLNGLSQTSSTTKFVNGAWDNGEPLLDLGESGFFYLMEVPEPGVNALLLLGFLSWWAARRRANA